MGWPTQSQFYLPFLSVAQWVLSPELPPGQVRKGWEGGFYEARPGTAHSIQVLRPTHPITPGGNMAGTDLTNQVPPHAPLHTLPASMGAVGQVGVVGRCVSS